MKTTSPSSLLSPRLLFCGALAASALLFLPSSASAATLVAQWDLNGGSPATTITSTFPTGPGVVSEDFSTSAGLAWGGSAGAAPGSTDYLSFSGTSAGGTLDTNVSGTSLAGTGAKTFVAWINSTMTTGTSSHQQGILSYTPTGGTGQGEDLRLLLDDDGTLRAEVSAGSLSYDSIDFRNAGWQMVAVIFGDGTNPSNTNNSSFYLGGTGILSPTLASNRAINTADTISGTSNPNLDFVMGNMHPNDTTHGFEGGIDMVKVYNGALSESDLDALYTSGAIPEPTSLALLALGAIALLTRRSRRRRGEGLPA